MSSTDSLTDDLERIIRAYEAALRAKPAPAIEDYLPVGPAQRGALLRELVHVDLEYRIKKGEAVRIEHYLDRFPELREDLSTVLELIEVEHTLRRRKEPDLGPGEYFERFPALRDRLPAALPDPPSP